MNAGVNIHRIAGSTRSNIAFGSPNDQRIRINSPRNSAGRRRRRRSARIRSISSVVRSASERSSRPIDASFRANPSTAPAERRSPCSASAATTSSAVRRPSKHRITPTSTGRKRKYFCVAGSFTTKLVSPRNTCSTIARSARRHGAPATPAESATLMGGSARDHSGPRHALARRESVQDLDTPAADVRADGHGAERGAPVLHHQHEPLGGHRLARHGHDTTLLRSETHRHARAREKRIRRRQAKDDLSRTTRGVIRRGRMQHGRRGGRAAYADNGRAIADANTGAPALGHAHAREQRSGFRDAKERIARRHETAWARITSRHDPREWGRDTSKLEVTPRLAPQEVGLSVL